MLEVLLTHQPYYALMYSAYDTPYAQKDPIEYPDVVKTIKTFLQDRVDLLLTAGFPREKIILDPGLGFFISSEARYSWEILERLDEIAAMGYPVLVGPSMKSFLGGEMSERREKTLEASRLALQHGASLLRVHHVPEHRQLIDAFPQIA